MLTLHSDDPKWSAKLLDKNEQICKYEQISIILGDFSKLDEGLLV